MAIIKENELFYIHAKDLTLILEQRGPYVFQKYMGKRIEKYNYSNKVIEKDHSFSANPEANDRTFSLDVQRQIVGTYGFGDTRQPSIRVEHTNNQLVQFKYKDYSIQEGIIESPDLPNPYSRDGSESSLTIEFEDEVAKLNLKVHYTTYEDSNTITTFTELTNMSGETVNIHEMMSVMLDLPIQNYNIRTFQGAYAREKMVRDAPLQQGIYQISSNRGASGHGQTPIMILSEEEHTTEDYGNALAVQLIYSGNFVMKAQRNQLEDVRILAGINPETFLWQLQPTESFNTPVAVLNFSDQGFTGLTHQSQDFVQNHLIPQQYSHKIRPILINNWEATYFDFSKKKLLEIAEKAQETGIELFVLDDGWFGNRSDDTTSLGDWVVNEEKIGGSLTDLIAEVNELGLDFGIWIEPEMISEQSDLYQAHPEWVIQAYGRPHTYSRSQLVLDLSNPEVIEYIKDIFDELLGSYNISYIKWDMNRNITNMGNGENYVSTMQQAHAYMLGLYDVLDYITTKYPEVLLESCAGGGGRNDLGMMRYASQVWASDNTDAIDRLMIQYGSSYLYPTISMGAHVSVAPNHQNNRLTSIDTRGIVAMMGNLGYELDLTLLPEDELLVVKAQIERYKSIRETVQLGRQYRLINPNNSSNEVAVQFVSENQVVMTYIRILSTIERMETIVKLKGLDPAVAYQELDSGHIYSGAELMYAGLTMDLPAGDFLGQQFIFNKL